MSTSDVLSFRHVNAENWRRNVWGYGPGGLLEISTVHHGVFIILGNRQWRAVTLASGLSMTFFSCQLRWWKIQGLTTYIHRAIRRFGWFEGAITCRGHHRQLSKFNPNASNAIKHGRYNSDPCWIVVIHCNEANRAVICLPLGIIVDPVAGWLV